MLVNKFFDAIGFGLLLCICPKLLSAQAPETISGFSPASGQLQLQLEHKLDELLSAQQIGEMIKVMSAEPHHVASPGGKKVIDYISSKFTQWGYQTSTETFYVMFPSPATRLLELVGSNTFKAKLQEPAFPQDATSGQAGQLPVYHCWSADGDVTAPLVYVNFGVPADYEMLQRMGIDVKGKIVIARYGQSWRGIKPKVAQEHGAIGCIIYSDPHEDGYFQGDVYPNGPYRPGLGAQRGSVMDMPLYPGDPLTPGQPATENAQRLKKEDAATLLKIPVIPIGYDDALPLLRQLGGQVVPQSWRGALPITYHVGPSTASVHLKLSFNWQIKPITNIIAKWPGAVFPDEWVIRGNHHDAWVNGAADPISGMAALMEEARCIAQLAKNGHPPARTLVFCGWDGEEPGLLGSTEWVEMHKKELQQKAVVYINTDGNGRGFVDAGGAHALEPAFSDILKQVKDPQYGVSVFERRKSADIMAASQPKEKQELMERQIYPLDPLGSGSDFSPFAQHIGVPVFNISFGGEDGGGEYHSVYDSYDHYSRFKDPGFLYGKALAQTCGRLSLRMANAPVLPFNFIHLHKAINQYSTEIVTLVNDMRQQTDLHNQLIQKGHYKLASNITAPLLVPAEKADVPFIDFSPLQNALAQLEKNAAQLNKVLQDIPPLKAKQINALLYQAEQQLLTTNGLPGRQWYRHSVYAPGLYTGYGVKTLPGIREAVEQRNWTEAATQINEASQAVNRLSLHLANIINLTIQ
jgi:N-acetylated-alpha-linked acidic dipeptidase